MIVIKRKWIQKSKGGLLEWQQEGWYLFGFIPLYIRDLTAHGRFP